MKNIHVLPTDKPSKLLKNIQYNTFWLSTEFLHREVKRGVEKLEYQNVYITSDEEIKEDDWALSKLNEVILFGRSYNEKFYKKIILTTDQDLIKDGVQAIDDEFLEWFVKNPSCEWVEVGYGFIRLTENDNKGYWISIPNAEFNMSIEEPKQKTLEEAAENYIKELNVQHYISQEDFVLGAKWQAERMYSEEDMWEAYKASNTIFEDEVALEQEFKEWLEQFKKK